MGWDEIGLSSDDDEGTPKSTNQTPNPKKDSEPGVVKGPTKWRPWKIDHEWHEGSALSNEKHPRTFETIPATGPIEKAQEPKTARTIQKEPSDKGTRESEDTVLDDESILFITHFNDAEMQGDLVSSNRAATSDRGSERWREVASMSDDEEVEGNENDDITLMDLDDGEFEDSI